MRRLLATMATFSTLALVSCGSSEADAEEHEEEHSPLETAYEECEDEDFSVLSYDSDHDVLMVNSLYSDIHKPIEPRDNSTESKEAHRQFLEDRAEYRDEVADIRSSQDAIYDCVLDHAAIPTHVDDQIGRTRALDGTQDAEWDEFSASWTFHGSQGLNLQISRF